MDTARNRGVKRQKTEYLFILKKFVTDFSVVSIYFFSWC